MNDIPRELLKEASGGKIDAFEQVYKLTSGFVYNAALRIIRNSADTEEVVQDVFIKVYHELKNFQFRSAFKTWLYRITVNTALNRYRKSRREEKGRVDYDGVIDSLADNRASAENTLQGETELRLNYLLGLLNTDHRVCLVLREIEGLSYQEIALVLGIPVNTVRSRLKRAREALLAEAKKREVKNAVQSNTGVA